MELNFVTDNIFKIFVLKNVLQSVIIALLSKSTNLFNLKLLKQFKT